MVEDPTLAAFQAALLSALDASDDPAEITRILLEDPAAAPFRDWVDTFDPDMVQVASALLRKWGQRAATDGAG